MKLFKKLRRKRTSSSTKVLKSEAEEKHDDIVTSRTSESTTEDGNSPNIDVDVDESTSYNKSFNGSTSRDNDSTLSSGSGEHVRSRGLLQSQQSGTILEEVRLDSERSMNESFSPGSPEYSVNDVEASSVIKVQSNYRRYLVMKQMEEEGKLTESQRHKAKYSQSSESDAITKSETISDELPPLPRFCGLSLLFNGALGGDSNVKENWGCTDKSQIEMAQDEIKGVYMKSSA
mmetsp:Transcript_10152/g.11864  ORF Transcript_10152/g.11864 Transcript_10152/m.11864 type:complete len:232 (+) Transcript_10152:45-740(+)